MLKIRIKRERLLKPLHMVSNIVEKKHSKPILSHILLIAENNRVILIGTDTEVELRGIIYLENDENINSYGQITLPGKKFFDICRSAPDNSIIELIEDDNKIIVLCGHSKFIMTSFPVSDFPKNPEQNHINNFIIEQRELRKLIEKTSFAIPQQDVRQYLNGLLFEIDNGLIQTLATDGHRLAMNNTIVKTEINDLTQVIIPKKGVIELLKLLDDSKESISVDFNESMIRINGKNFVLISKLINSKFPNYKKIIPTKGDIMITAVCDELKSALIRVNILSNELLRSVQFRLNKNILTLATNNPNQEEAIEELIINHHNKNYELDIMFNISYFIDILNVVETPMINIFFKNSDSGVVVEEACENKNSLYVLMPIRQ